MERVEMYKFRLDIPAVLLILGCFLISDIGFAQDKEAQQREKESERHVRRAEAAKAKKDFAGAEAEYRRALSRDSDNSAANYNFSHLYNEHEKEAESMRQLMESAKSAKTKELRHKTFHNLGNAFMDHEDYEQAVRAYKDALRNNPTDDETRYNLALAKDKLENQQDDGDDQDEDDDSGGGEDDQQQDDDDSSENAESEDQEDDNDDDDDQDQQDNQDNQEGNDQDQDEDGDQESEGQPDEQDDDDDDSEEDDQDEGEGEQPPRDGQLSKEQIENLLRAAENLEKETQKKRDKEKAKEVKVNPREKDW